MESKPEARSQQPPAGAGDEPNRPAVRDALLAPAERHDAFWALVGPNGLRAGWSGIFFIALYYLFLPVLGTIAVTVHPSLADPGFPPMRVLVTETLPLLAILGAGIFLAHIEHRHIRDYYIRDSRWLARFFSGAVAGFVALSILIGILASGGWIQFGPRALSGMHALKYGALWGLVFLVVGFFEEGSFRCYLQYTLTRGINFWWALCAVAATCLATFAFSNPRCAPGVYAVAAAGLLPCFWLHLTKTERSAFWQAAWVTSTAFGANHAANPGENAIGIFAAAFIGFVFCVSVRVTGSVWWAIGCHSTWDWAETYFYGTANSGLTPQSHLLSTHAVGNPLWSGGSDGPEGSLLVVPVAALLMVFLFFARNRSKLVPHALPATERLAL